MSSSSSSSSAAAAAGASGGTSKSAIPKLPPGVPKPQDGWKLFSEALTYVLSKWDLLRVAVIEEWGGRGSRRKFDHIVEDLIENCHEQWREGNDLHIDTLDVYLLECLEADFGIDFEDDSVVTEMSAIIQDFYRKCAAGDLVAARTALDGLASHPAMQESKRGEGSDEDEEGSDSGSDGDGAAAAGAGKSSGPRRVIDEDGWETVVTKPKKKGQPPPSTTGGSSVAPGPGAADSTAGNGDGSADGDDHMAT